MSNHHEDLVSDYTKNVLPSFIPGISLDVLTGSKSGPDHFGISLGSDFAKGTHYEPVGKRFVHFTSLSALQSIINDNAIRLYNLLNVNDPNEYNYFSSELISDNETRKLKKNIYILSLCHVSVLESDNILNLWRLYGREGFGVAIEFEIDFSGHSSDGGYTLGKVLYEKPVLENFRKINLEFEKRNNVSVDIKELEQVPRCFHKNPHYKIEEEVRLMFFDRLSTKRATYKPNYSKFRWDFNSRNELVTYNNLELDQKIASPRISIKRIQLGFRHLGNLSKLIDHFESIYLGRQMDGLTLNKPIIEISPLGEIFL